MRISIGVPAYNQGQYLAETLDSLLNQTVLPDEIVVSDNHSTDETPEILRRYEGRVRVIRPPEHLSMTANWNFVVENLSGEWFSLLSSDDVAERGFIQHLSRAVRHDRNAVLVRGGWLTISPSGQPTGRCLLWSTSTVTEPPRTLTEQLQAPKASFAAFLCRRSAWERVGGSPTSLRIYGDWGLWLRLSAVGSFVTTHRVVARYRTGYPVERTADRIVDCAHDERVIATEVAPQVADLLGLPQETGRLTMRPRLLGFLAAAAVVCDSVTRARVADELRPMAAALCQERMLDRFVEGKAISAPPKPGITTRGRRALAAQFRTLAHSARYLAGRE